SSVCALPSLSLRSPLFPYTTLFRSRRGGDVARRPEQGGEDDPGLVLCDRLQLILLLHGGELLVHPPVRVDVAIPGHRLLEGVGQDRKSTRLNSSHVSMPYAVFCLQK